MTDLQLTDIADDLAAWAAKRKRDVPWEVLVALVELRAYHQGLGLTEWPEGSVAASFVEAWPAQGPVAAPAIDAAAAAVETLVGFLRGTGRLASGSGEAKALAKEARRGAAWLAEHADDRALWSETKVLLDFAAGIGLPLEDLEDRGALQERADEVRRRFAALPEDERARLMPAGDLGQWDDLAAADPGHGAAHQDRVALNPVELAAEVWAPGEVPAVLDPSARDGDGDGDGDGQGLYETIADRYGADEPAAALLLALVVTSAQDPGSDVTPDVFDDAWDEVPALADVRALVEWVGRGRRLTRDDNLTRADARDAWTRLDLATRPDGDHESGEFGWARTDECLALERLIEIAVEVGAVEVDDDHDLVPLHPESLVDDGQALVAEVAALEGVVRAAYVHDVAAMLIYAVQVGWILRRPVALAELEAFSRVWDGAGQEPLDAAAVADLGAYLGLLRREGDAVVAEARGAYVMATWAMLLDRRARA